MGNQQIKHNLEINDKNEVILSVLIIGETGSGKTTLINTLDVWEQDIPLNKLEKVKVKTEFLKGQSYTERGNEKTSQLKSQTTIPETYEFNLKLNRKNCSNKLKNRLKNEQQELYNVLYNKEQTVVFQVTVLDTPGFADTEAVNDKSIEEKNIQNILFKFSDWKSSKINGIIFLMNGAIKRSQSLPVVLNSLKQIFPKGFENNFRILQSNTTIPYKEVLSEFKFLKTDQIYCYNNRIFLKNLKVIRTTKDEIQHQLENNQDEESPEEVEERIKGDDQCYTLDKAERDFKSVIESLSCLIFELALEIPQDAKIFHSIGEINTQYKSSITNLIAKLRRSLEQETENLNQVRHNTLLNKQLQNKLKTFETLQENQKRQLSKLINDQSSIEEQIKKLEHEQLQQKEAQVIQLQYDLSHLNKDMFKNNYKLIDSYTDYHNEFQNSDDIKKVYTICSHSSCQKQYCDNNCWQEKKEDCVVFRRFIVMRSNKCDVCNHDIKYHSHEQGKYWKPKQFETYGNDEQKENEDFSQKVLQIQKKIQEQENDIDQINNKKNKMQQDQQSLEVKKQNLQKILQLQIDQQEFELQQIQLDCKMSNQQLNEIENDRKYNLEKIQDLTFQFQDSYKKIQQLIAVNTFKEFFSCHIRDEENKLSDENQKKMNEHQIQQQTTLVQRLKQLLAMLYEQK